MIRGSRRSGRLATQNLRLDELRQLRNVYRGELSFVGPRPERPEFYQAFWPSAFRLFSLRLLVRPGDYRMGAQE